MRRRKGEEEGEAATRAPCSNPSREKEREREAPACDVTSRPPPLDPDHSSARGRARTGRLLYVYSIWDSRTRARRFCHVSAQDERRWMGGLRWEFSRGQPSFPWELHQRQDGGAALGVMGNNGNGQPGRGEMREGGRLGAVRCACYLSVSLLVCRRVWGGAEHCGEFDLARVCASSLASPLPPPARLPPAGRCPAALRRLVPTWCCCAPCRPSGRLDPEFRP